MTVIANEEGISFNELVKDHCFNCTVKLDGKTETLLRAYYGNRGLYNGDLHAILFMSVFCEMQSMKDERETS